MQEKMEELALAIGDIIVGIDIGTSKVSLIIGEVNNFNQIEIICSTNQTCSGIKKGKIVDEAEVVRALDRVLEDAEADTDLKINSAYVTVNGRHVTIVQNCVTKEIKDKYIGITQKDVSSAKCKQKT